MMFSQQAEGIRRGFHASFLEANVFLIHLVLSRQVFAQLLTQCNIRSLKSYVVEVIRKPFDKSK